MDVVRTELTRVVLAALLGAIVACDDGAPVQLERPWRAPADVIDSALSVDEQLRRYRASLPDSASRFADGTTTQAALVRRLVQAIAQRDADAALALMITESEFAWLYYPTSPFADGAFSLPPALAWFQIRTNAEADARRTIERLGGRSLEYVSHSCSALADYGPNRLYSDCSVQLRHDSGRMTESLFGTIVERDGIHKFLGLATRAAGR